MNAIEFVVEHLEAILAAYQETGSSKAAWEKLKGSIPKIEQSMSFPTFRQYGGLLVGLNRKLNIPYLLKCLDELNTVKQLNAALNQYVDKLNKNNRLNIEVKQGTVKQKLNIAGWNIQVSAGYYRAFKKVAGKMQAVYLGKDLTDAEMKISQKENRLK
ncbi:MAG: hypothetical protein V1844_23970 [Pseudomonadota bacterium]